MIKIFRKFISNTISKMGYEIHRKRNTDTSIPAGNKKFKIVFDLNPGTQNRPIGDLNAFLWDIRGRGFKCDNAVDIGSNKTQWSRMLKKIFPKVKIYLIDPLEEMEDYMKSFCEEFKDSQYFVTGVGSMEETKILTLNGEDMEGSTMLVEKIPSYLRANKQREVKVITLDSLIQDQGLIIPDLVKMDIQGFELEALKGCQGLFGKTEMFIIEVSLFKFNSNTPDVMEILNFMNNRGYVVYDFPSYLRRPFDGALAQVDICFIKSDSILKSSFRWDKEPDEN